MILLNPPSPADAVANREGTASFGALSAGFAYPPHTLAVIVAACRRAGQMVQVVDSVGEKLDLPAVVARVPSAADRAAVYCAWGTLAADCQALAGLRAALPELPLLAIGAGARFNAADLLAAGASHVVVGDPELALPVLAAGPLPPPGIVRSRDLLPDQHNHAGLLRNPNLLPRPAWDAVPWQAYGFLSIFGSRGCDDRCKFCAYAAVQGHAMRTRPPADVVAEMLWLAETYQPRRILVRDLVFAADRVWAMQVARGLRQAGFGTPWECESRPEHFDRALLQEMAAAGCTVIKLGIESADPAQLVAINRIDHVTEAAPYLACTRRVIADARRVGIATRVFVLVGLPDQTLAQVRQTAAYLHAARPTFVHARPFVAYPHVPLGQAQPPAATAALAAVLQPVVDACEARARRGMPLAPRLRLRLHRALTQRGW